MSERRNSISISGIENQLSAKNAESQANLISMQSRLRDAVYGAISEADVAAIIKKQVDKAKEGDARSLEFVAKYVLGFGQPVNIKNTTVIATDVATAARIAKSAGGAIRDAE